ncbi:CHASE2 domain-containing protein [Coleofasciculus sp. FACHB-T130]|uniref:CHASE2 domain-containing protein n=1 Tax=Cyanophyceae TaxID=3028117 RepID=UPI0018EF71F6|nr:CHASE2 domain-containing protein [Coleofasciculus sp. FACHB-T130]
MMDRIVFKLRVKQVGTVCDFELSWGKGKILSVELNYPLSLTRSYEQWQSAYLNYYRRLRGHKVISGKGTLPVDRHRELVNAEVQLGEEFQHWLLTPELVSIRREIVKAAHKPEHHTVEVFLTCTPLELARLPWEIWEIGTDLGATQQIRIARTPANILNEPVRPIRRKARVLAILGDDTGLNLEADREALRSLDRVADIQLIGWKRNQGKAELNIPKSIEARFFDADALKMEIQKAIASEPGWDILFFAGHSNETVLTGGELGIAPHTSISIREIEESLKQAKKRGLQFAIFNSCSGMNIAESLINLGLSQVAVMREPIHNQVAQEFLVQFLASLTQYKDVHSALLEASLFLKQQEKHLSYPSAYLVPSLFRHPEAELFCIKPFGFFDTLNRWLPTKKEACWLGAILFLSLLPPVQNLLLEPRILLQAFYRKVTLQVPAKGSSPVRLIQIDDESLKADADKIKQIYPIDYRYVALLLNRVSELEAKTVGIDYILDDKKQPNNSLKLKQSVQNIVNKNTWLVFGSGEGESTPRSGVSKDIANLNWSLEGDIMFFPWYVELLPAEPKSSQMYPFAYLLAIAYVLNQELPPNLPQPNLQARTNFNLSVINYLNLISQSNQKIAFLQEIRLHSLTRFSQNFIQAWFHPIIDFSIPPESAYERISACKLLGDCLGKGKVPDTFKNEVVLITPGGYKGAGLEGENEDNYAIPLAVGFWRGWEEENFPGGEAHAYMLHHLLTRRLVIPIPDLWMILLSGLLGKSVTLMLQDNLHQRQRWVIKLGTATTIYIIASLQIYISAAMLLPWFLPTVLFWNYIRLAFREKSHV